MSVVDIILNVLLGVGLFIGIVSSPWLLALIIVPMLEELMGWKDE